MGEKDPDEVLEVDDVPESDSPEAARPRPQPLTPTEDPPGSTEFVPL